MMSRTERFPAGRGRRVKKNTSVSQLYLDIGGKSVLCGRITGIFDMDNSTTEKATVEFLGQSEKNGGLENLCSDIPVSFIVCDGESQSTVYLSPLSGRTLARTVNGKM